MSWHVKKHTFGDSHASTRIDGPTAQTNLKCGQTTVHSLRGPHVSPLVGPEVGPSVRLNPMFGKTAMATSHLHPQRGSSW
uniref:Uncharacterized protein n=1 Tax=Oryza rufipogon TaxID=4529 RepID=A0A0E0P6H5_ORYRU